MRNPLRSQLSLALLLALTVSGPSEAHGTRDTTTYRRFKAALDAIPAIDTHDHLMPFDRLPAVRETDRGKGVNLAGLWQNSYYTWNHRLEPWTPGMRFDAWWQKAKHDFDDSRAASFYRYQLPAFTDLYGVDFETLTDEAARELDDRIFTNQNDVARIDAMIHAYDRPGAPGISVIVVKDRTVLYKKAYGLADVEAGVPNTTNTNFRLASVTKQFTAMAILILMERGKLGLESHVVDFFPDFPAYGREITIRQLLNHTSGLPDYAALIPANQKQQLSDEDVLRILKQATKGDFRPGSKFEYSNSGYVLLGLIAAKVSGKSFARFLEESIFQPLGMSSTVAYEPGISTVKNRAYGYTPSGKTFRRTDQSLTSATLGDGGIYSSVEDLYYWDQALNTTKLVGAKTLEQAFSPGNYGNGQTSNYGFGWFVDTVGGIRAASHGGSTVGFRNHIVRLPDEKLTVIVLMNRSDGVPAEIADNIARSYCPDFTGSPRLP